MNRIATAMLLLCAILFAGCALLGNTTPVVLPPLDACTKPAPDVCGSNFWIDAEWDESPLVYGWNVKVLPDTARDEITKIATQLASINDSDRRFVMFYEGTREAPGFYSILRGPVSLEDPLPEPAYPEQLVATFDFVGDMSPSVVWYD